MSSAHAPSTLSRSLKAHFSVLKLTKLVAAFFGGVRSSFSILPKPEEPGVVCGLIAGGLRSSRRQRNRPKEPRNNSLNFGHS